MKKLFVIISGRTGLRLSVAAKAITRGEFTVEAVSFSETGFGEFFSAGVSRIYAISGAADELGKARSLAALCKREKPEIVLFPSTVEFCAVAPMAAALLHTGLTADCISLSLTSEGKLLQTRPALGGSVTADILCEKDFPQMATVKESALPPVAGLLPGNGEVIRETGKTSSAIRLLSSLPRMESAASLQDAEIILSGGKGMGSKEGFTRLRELSSLIPGARVGASRGAVSASYAPYECQVGLTGEFVRPKIYIAFGISGAVQHLAGMKESGTIISVNTDERAPIFDYSDIAVIAPWRDVVDEMILALQSAP